MALHRQVADDPLGIRALGHVFNVGGFNLFAQRPINGLTAFIMLMHPACVGQGRDVNKAYFQWRLQSSKRGDGLGNSG